MSTPPIPSSLPSQLSHYQIPPDIAAKIGNSAITENVKQYLSAHAGEIAKVTSIWDKVGPFFSNPAAIKGLLLKFVTSHIIALIASALGTTALIALGIVIWIALVALNVLIGIGIYKIIKHYTSEREIAATPLPSKELTCIGQKKDPNLH